MPAELKFEKPFKSGIISLTCFKLGKDLQLIISGGQAHIGAVALAVCYDRNRAAVNVSQIAVYGHREDALCREVAATLSKGLKTTVAVSAGIHFDGLLEEDIAEIMQISKELTEELLNYFDSNGL